MRFRTWIVAALGLSSLLLLVVVSMLTSSRRAREIFTQLDQLNTHYQDVDAKLRRLRSDVNLSGIVVTLVAVFRLRVLERRSDRERALAEGAERQLRQLSQQLVATQEEERKNLSRELHDHVAQVLTALRMELGRIDRIRAPGDTRIGLAVGECKQLVDSMFRTVRDLALGLRPSMLDDFGLRAALEWHVRDFSGRYGVNVALNGEEDFDTLPDQYRTCVYRAVQEALTNCIRHAQARSIQVRLNGQGGQLHLFVTDDGIGFDPARRHAGLGLHGIGERVKELHGVMSVGPAEVGVGTTLAVSLPWPALAMEAPLARAAG